MVLYTKGQNWKAADSQILNSQKLNCDQNAKESMYIKFISTDKNKAILEQMRKSLLTENPK